jgi:hypothetical protein
MNFIMCNVGAAVLVLMSSQMSFIMGFYLLVLVVSDGMWMRRLTSLTMSR